MKKTLSVTTVMMSLALVALFITTDDVHSNHTAFAVEIQENTPAKKTVEDIKLDLTVPDVVYPTNITPVQVKVSDNKSGKPISHVDWAISVKDPSGNVVYRTTTAHSHAGIMNFNVAFPQAGEHTISLTASSIGPKMMGMDVPAKARTHTLISGSLAGFEDDPFNNFGSRTFDFPVYVQNQKMIRNLEGSNGDIPIIVELAAMSDKIVAGEPTTLLLTTSNPNGDPMISHVDALIKVRKGFLITSDSAERGSEMMPMNGAYHGHLGQVSFTTAFPSPGTYIVNADLSTVGVSNVQFGMASARFAVSVYDAGGEITQTSSSSEPGKVDIVGLESPFYAPNNIKVSSGETIVFDNVDANFHTVTSGSAQNGPSDAFDSGLLSAGEKYSLTLDKPGTYDYFCTIHTNMQGTITVV